MAVDMGVLCSELFHYFIWNECCSLNSVILRKDDDSENSEGLIFICKVPNGAQLARFILNFASSAFDLILNSRSVIHCVKSGIRVALSVP